MDPATDPPGFTAKPKPVVYTRPTVDDQETIPAAFATGGNTIVTVARTQTFISNNSNLLYYDRNRLAGTSYYHTPRGSWKLQALYVLDGAAPGGRRSPKPSDTTVYVTFKVTEPLLISPFVFGAPEGKQGLYGIQTMNF